MRFGSVCSGIEAASVAFHPLGWRAAWLSEIEPFPSAVLAHHYPGTPNLGDMTGITRRVITGEVEAPDVLCGGTPCQAFSVAGLRESLNDDRGNLTLTFCELADAIDFARTRAGHPPAIVFWENVPGVLSTRDNAFGCFLAGLAGEDGALEPPGGKWTNAGCVHGPARTVAWRTLDAQYFGLAQRRRRVFVVASARKGFDPAQVLFEWDGVRRDTAPSREARQTAPTIPARSTAGDGLGTDFDCDGGLQVAGTMKACKDSGGWSNSADHAAAGYMIPVETLCVATGQAGAEIGADMAPTLNCNHEAPIAAYGIRTANTSSNGWGIQEEVTHTLDCAQGVAVAHTAHTLRGEGFDASEDGTGRSTPLVPVPVQPYTLAIRGRGDSHDLEYRQDGTANALLTPGGGRGGIGVGAIAHAFDAKQSDVIQNATQGKDQNGFGIGHSGDPMYTLDQGSQHAIAFDTYNQVVTGDVVQTLCSRGDTPGGNAHLVPAVAFTQNQRDEVRELAVAGALAAEPGMKQQTFVAQAFMADDYKDGGYEECNTARPLDTDSHSIGVLAEYYSHDYCGDRIYSAAAVSPCLNTAQQHKVRTGLAVRRLTATECEFLQGFPRNYTAIPWRGKPADLCPDGPRYKALGNSWAVPVVRWIGERIQRQLGKKETGE